MLDLTFSMRHAVHKASQQGQQESLNVVCMQMRREREHPTDGISTLENAYRKSIECLEMHGSRSTWPPVGGRLGA